MNNPTPLHSVNWSPFGLALVIFHPSSCMQPVTTLHIPSIPPQGMHVLSFARKEGTWSLFLLQQTTSKSISIYHCTYPSNSDLCLSILTSEPNIITNQQLPRASVLRCWASACHDHAWPYNKPAMMLLAYFLMSCAAELKRMTGDLQLNMKKKTTFSGDHLLALQICQTAASLMEPKKNFQPTGLDLNAPLYSLDVSLNWLNRHWGWP